MDTPTAPPTDGPAETDTTATGADPLADLEAKSEDELRTLETDLVSKFDAADEADDLDAMSAAADSIDSVRAEIDRRGSAAAADEPEAVSDGDEVAVAASGAEPDAEPAEAEPADEPDTNDADGADAADDTDEPDAGDSTEPEATTAGGDKKENTVSDIPEDRKPEPVQTSATIVAAANVPSVAAGHEFGSGLAVAEAMVKQLDAVSRDTSPGEQNYHVATIVAAAAPPERFLETSDIEGNLAKIEAVTRDEAITAAGGYCAPLETRYDIFGTGVTDRPVRDALAGFQARRGGIRYTQAPKIADFAGASGIWTAANDENPTSPTTKPCLVVECSPEVTAMVDAVTLCLQFGNLVTRAFPELVDRNNQLALVAHARYAERALLSKLTALSTSVTSAFRLGTARDFLNAVGRAATAYRHRYRMNPSQPLRVLAPIWVRDAVREDLAMQMPGNGDSLAVADNAIDMYMRVRNVNVSWHLDAPGFPDEVAASTLDDFPTSFEWYIYAEGAFIFLDGGTLDLGIVRDADLVGTNDYKTFTESFEGVARVGAESIRVTTTTRPAGATAGTVDTTV